MTMLIVFILSWLVGMAINHFILFLNLKIFSWQWWALTLPSIFILVDIVEKCLN